MALALPPPKNDLLNHPSQCIREMFNTMVGIVDGAKTSEDAVVKLLEFLCVHEGDYTELDDVGQKEFRKFLNDITFSMFSILDYKQLTPSEATKMANVIKGFNVSGMGVLALRAACPPT